MGITRNSLDRLNRLGLLNKSYNMLELGCQNIYDDTYGANYGMIAKDFFIQKNINHTSLDITGCQCSQKVDLREDISNNYDKYDVITDYGTTEHIENFENGGFYQAFKNIHTLCKVGGYMIHETPLTNHWHNHAFNYLNEDFYKILSADAGYKIIELNIEYAMGNYESGGLVCCALIKLFENDFVSKDKFQKYNVSSF